MGPIMLAFGGTFFVVLAIGMRTRRIGSNVAQWLGILAGLYGLAVAYYTLTPNIPLWIRIAVPIAAFAGWALAGLRLRHWPSKRGQALT